MESGNERCITWHELFSQAPVVRLDIPEIGYLLLRWNDGSKNSPVILEPISPPKPNPEPEPSPKPQSKPPNPEPSPRFQFFESTKDLREALMQFFKEEPQQLRLFVDNLNKEDDLKDVLKGVDYENLGEKIGSKEKKDPPNKIRALINKFQEKKRLELLKNKFEQFKFDREA